MGASPTDQMELKVKWSLERLNDGNEETQSQNAHYLADIPSNQARMSSLARSLEPSRWSLSGAACALHANLHARIDWCMQWPLFLLRNKNTTCVVLAGKCGAAARDGRGAQHTGDAAHTGMGTWIRRAGNAGAHAQQHLQAVSLRFPFPEGTHCVLKTSACG